MKSHMTEGAKPRVYKECMTPEKIAKGFDIDRHGDDASCKRNVVSSSANELTLHDETSLTRGLRPLVEAGWVAVRAGDDRREKWFRITAEGVAKLEEDRPAWERAQARIQALLPEGAWRGLLEILPEVARLTAGS